MSSTLLPEIVRGSLRPLRERVVAGASNLAGAAAEVTRGVGMVGAMVAEMARGQVWPSLESLRAIVEAIGETLDILRRAREDLVRAGVDPELLTRVDDVIAKVVTAQQSYLHATWESRGRRVAPETLAAIEAGAHQPGIPAEEALKILSEAD